MEFGVESHGLQRINPTNLGDPLTFLVLQQVWMGEHKILYRHLQFPLDDL